MTTVNTRYAATGQLGDGTPVVFEISQGTPLSFNMVDAVDGTRLDAHSFDDVTTGSAITLSPDGSTVYFSVRGGGTMHLCQYRIESGELTILATNPVGESMTRNLVATDTVLYGSTFPNAKVYSYDLTTGEIHDYGPMAADSGYAWGLEVVDDQVWVGVGIGNGQLIVLDPETGATEAKALPDHVVDPTLIHTVRRRGNLVICVFQPTVEDTNVAVWDIEAGDWTGDHEIGVIGLNGAMTEPTADGLSYYMGFDGFAEIYAFDPATGTETATGWGATPIGQDRTGFQNMGLSNLGTADQPHYVVTGILLTGRHWMFDPATTEHQMVIDDIVGSPIGVHTLDLGPNDNIYTGAHLSSGVMGMIDTRTDTVSQMIGPSQADSVTEFDGKIVVGTYPGAGVHAGDPDQAWEWGTNPSELFTLERTGPYQQDRPRSLIAAGGQVAMATVPTYGELGGAVTLFTLDGEFSVHRNILPDHSVVSLAYSHGLIVAGTSIDGGLDSTPRAPDAEVFVWDPATETRTFHAVPDPGARSVGAVCVARDSVWGLTDTGVLFELDPVRGEITRTVTGAPTTATTWGSSTFLQYRRHDRRFYGANGARMFIFDPETGELEWNMNFTVGRIVINRRGQIYYSSGTNVYRYLPPPPRRR